VIAILPTAQAESRTLTVRIELANSGSPLRPGMFATVALGDEGQPGLLVPSEAVIRTGARNPSFLPSPTDAIGQRRSGLAARAGQNRNLTGLAPGEKVAASGQFLLDSEASLSGVPARPIGDVR
jgi:Cu(I)/Ag(I) efflux system membrane fusion protein